MKNIKPYTFKALVFFSVFFIISGCYKDKGNYEYVELDQVLIDTSNLNIQDSYSLYRYDTLTIAPKIYFNGKQITDESSVKDQLSFTWSIYQANIGGTLQTRDTLSHKIILNNPITKPTGGWIVMLTVRDLKTNTDSYQKFNLQLDESLSDGWMVMYEKDGNTDVGLIVDERSKPGTVNQRIFTDIIKNTNGAALEGKPISLLQSASPLTSKEVVVASEKDMQAFNYTDFERAFSFENFFYGAPTTKALTAFTANNARKEFVINNNKIHVANFSSGTTRTILFSVPLSGNFGELANWNPKFYAQGFDAVAYDKTNKKFVYVVAGSIAVSDIPAQTATTAEWSPSNVGLDLKVSDYGRLNYEYLIMNDANNHYLLTANFMGTAPLFALKKYNISDAPDISNVSAMASSSTGSYILYGANEKVYLHKYETNQAIENIWTAPAGEKITSIRFLKFYFTTAQTIRIASVANQYVYFATYNESTKEGKVYNVKIDQTNGSIDSSTLKVYEGFGKITDMSLKWFL
ncbi:PKD-like family lipoprotein [Sphingobacterium sp. LRF_L2]|uniref:PKD-like family lipoprotein n=1 Tax=Sphingobacterium sp. LRF_L2 TaxID=3369421 RepID=UPI003F633182